MSVMHWPWLLVLPRYSWADIAGQQAQRPCLPAVWDTFRSYSSQCVWTCYWQPSAAQQSHKALQWMCIIGPFKGMFPLNPESSWLKTHCPAHFCVSKVTVYIHCWWFLDLWICSVMGTDGSLWLCSLPSEPAWLLLIDTNFTPRGQELTSLVSLGVFVYVPPDWTSENC